MAATLVVHVNADRARKDLANDLTAERKDKQKYRARERHRVRGRAERSR